MRALVFAGPGRAEVRDVPDPELTGPEDVLIDVEAAAVCGTDLHILAVPSVLDVPEGLVLGHEFVGRVGAKGAAVDNLEIGQRVAVQPNLPCGRCGQCMRLRPTLCPYTDTLGITSDGGLAERAVVPATAAIPVPADLSPNDAVLTELLACVLRGCAKVTVRPGESALVLGAGAAGLLFIQALRASGANVVTVEPHEGRRAAALAAGADAAFAPGDPVTRAGADLVVDCAGALLADALAAAGPAARVLVFGMAPNARNEIPTSTLPLHELAVTGTFGGLGFFPDAVKLLAAGAIRADLVISARRALAEMPAALDDLRGGREIKVAYDATLDASATPLQDTRGMTHVH